MGENYNAEIIHLAHTYVELRAEKFHSALNYALPVLQLLDRQLLESVQHAPHLCLKYRRINMLGTASMSVLSPTGFVGTSLTEVVALGWNKRFGDDSDFRTCIGAMVRNGKQYGPNDGPPDVLSVRALSALVILVEKFTTPHRQTDLVISMPSSRGSFNQLPTQVVRNLAEAMGWEIGDPSALNRDRLIHQMKSIQDYDGKLAAIRNTMEADSSEFGGKRVLIVDDLLDSGASLREAARALRAAGATDVRAITLEKSRRYPREIFRDYGNA